MNNLFEISNYPDKEPEYLLSGKRWSWVKPDVTEAYPISEYTLKYTFTNMQAIENNFTFNASKIDGKHIVEQSTESTANYVAGEYLTSIEIVRDSDQESILIGEAIIEVRKENSGSLAHAIKTLSAIRATIEGTATESHKSMTINGRSLERFSIDELIMFEKEYANKVTQEKQKLALNNGKSINKRTRLRMNA